MNQIQYIRIKILTLLKVYVDCCGVTAHLSPIVDSAPLGHILITKGCRFEFSHAFAPLLLTQMIKVLEGVQNVSYCLRVGYYGSSKKINGWKCL